MGEDGVSGFERVQLAGETEMERWRAHDMAMQYRWIGLAVVLGQRLQQAVNAFAGEAVSDQLIEHLNACARDALEKVDERLPEHLVAAVGYDAPRLETVVRVVPVSATGRVLAREMGAALRAAGYTAELFGVSEGWR